MAFKAYILSILICLQFLFISGPVCFAQPGLPTAEIHVDYNTETGYLPTGKISEVLPGRYGYLWVAAEKGLFRYNGRIFEPTCIGGSDEIYRMSMIRKDLLLLMLRSGHTKGIDVRNLTPVNTDSLLGLDKLKTEQKRYSAVFIHKDNILLIQKKYLDSTRKIPSLVLVSGNKAILPASRDESTEWLRKYVFHDNKNVDPANLFDKWLNSLSFLSNKPNLLFLGRQLYDSTGRLILDGRALGEEKIISAALLRGKELWIGFLNGGMIRYDHFADSGLQGHATKLLDAYLISSITADDLNNVWVNTFSNGLVRFKSADIHVLQYNRNVSGLPANELTSALKTAAGLAIVYSATSNTLAALSDKVSIRKTDPLQGIFTRSNNSFLLSKNGIQKLAIRENGTIGNAEQVLKSDGGTLNWIDNIALGDKYYCLSAGAIFSLDAADRVKTLPVSIPENTTTFQPLDDSVFLMGTTKGIYKTQRKLPWLPEVSFLKIRKIGTELICCTGAGIYVVPADRIEQQDQVQLLSNEIALSMEDDEHFIFFRTIHGIMVMAKSNKKILAHHSFLNFTLPFSISDFFLDGDYIAVAGSAGLFYFPKLEFLGSNKLVPKIHILNSLNHNIPADTICYRHYSNQLEASFTLEILDGDNDKKNIKYRILKDGNIFYDWTVCNEFTPIRINHPEPGTYKIQYWVNASDANWQKEITYTMIVSLSWWQTWWAKMLFLFALLGLLGFLVTRYIRYKINQNQEKFKTELRNKDLEARALFSQLNSHFVFNALVPFQQYIIKGESDNALAYINKFAVLMRSILNSSRLKIISLKAELSFLQYYLEVQQQLHTNFDFSIVLEEGLDAESIYIPTMFLQPLVENAVEHGIRKLPYRGRVELMISALPGKTLCIAVSDNGRGYDDVQKIVDHHAIQIIRERLDLIIKMHQEAGLLLENNTTGGAKAVLKLPYTIVKPTDNLRV